jgi:putative ABC transport system permease protein
VIRLVLQGLRHDGRLYLGLVASIAVACAVLVGGLAVGDSLREGLRLRTEQRLGPVDFELSTTGRWFGPELVDRLEEHTSARIAPVFSVESAAKSAADRVTAAQVLGVDQRLWEMAGMDGAPGPGEVLLNAALASALQVEVGDKVIFRFTPPDSLPVDSALRGGDGLASLRLKVAAIRGGAWPLDLDLLSSGQLPLNAFVNLTELEQSLGHIPVNRLLVDCDCGASELEAALEQAWRLEDAQLALREVSGLTELRSERVLLDPEVASAAMSLSSEATAIASWFVDEAKGEGGSSAYFFVAAAAGEADERAAALSRGLGAKEIALADVLATQLGAALGSQVQLRIPVLGPRQQVVYTTRDFKVARIFSLDAETVDSSWMPAIPGMEGASSCADWETGLPVDLSRIGPEDERLWRAHGGSPRAALALETARGLWSNPYGALSAVRLPASQPLEAVERALRDRLEPGQFGLFFRPVGAKMSAASDPVNDFGQLFLGFNFFLIGASLFLVGVFAGFAVDRRRAQLGVLAAMGYSSGRLRSYLLLELGLLCALGCGLGLVGSVGVAQGLLYGLAGVWSQAVGQLAFPLTFSLNSMAGGAVMSWLVGVGAAWFGVRYALRSSPWRNLRGRGTALEGSTPRNTRGFTALGLVLIGLGLSVALLTEAGRGPSRALVFFGCGGLVLSGLLAWVWAWLRRSVTSPRTSLYAVGAAGLRVNPSTSFSVVAVMAFGVYLVGGVGGGTLQPAWDPSDPSSGTGGFDWVARLAIPVQQDLSVSSGLETYGLGAEFKEQQLIGLGVVDGDDASCKNLGSAQQPRLLGVEVEAFEDREAFHFLAPASGSWALLRGEHPEGVIPVVGDSATVYWGLHLSLGDRLDALDEYGRPVVFEIVGIVDNWMLQGALVADRVRLSEGFPSSRGDHWVLVDVDSGAAEAGALLHRRLADHGVLLQRPGDLLEGYLRVERTFMLIFGAMGGLGMLLAVAGVGALSYRRHVERRRAVALMSALGFTQSRLVALASGELLALIGFGVGCGGVASAVALIPAATQAHWAPLVQFCFVLLGIFGFLSLVLLLQARATGSPRPGAILGRET